MSKDKTEGAAKKRVREETESIKRWGDFEDPQDSKKG